MKPGVYRGVSFEQYRAIAAANKSGLEWLAQSPLHYWANCLDPKREPDEPTAAMKLGSAIHCAVLEPKEFAARYAKAPACDRRTKAGKEIYEAFLAEAGAREILSADDFETCEKIAVAVRRNISAEAILEAGSAEVTLVWQDKIEGVLCKARLDWLAPGVIFDLKSTQLAAPVDFAKQVANLNYHVQAAFYIDGLETLTGEQATFVFGAIEKAAPYAFGSYYLDPASLDAGRKLYRQWLAKYAECLRTKKWPGYREEIVELSLPPWALKGAPREIAEF